MEKYLGVKIVQASKQFKVIKDLENDSKCMPIVYLDNVDDIENNENIIFEGYKVVYEDGYTSWSPKDVFEKAYKKVGNYSSILVDADTITGEWNWYESGERDSAC